MVSQYYFLIDAVTYMRLVKSQKLNMISIDYLYYKEAEEKKASHYEKYKGLVGLGSWLRFTSLLQVLLGRAAIYQLPHHMKSQN